MLSQTVPVVVAVPPLLIGTCIDRLRRLPPAPSRTSDQLILVAVCTGRDEQEAAALFVRLVTAAFICRDQRWLAWRVASRSPLNAAIAFEATVLDLFATLPLEHDLAASADAFFAAILIRMRAQGRA